MEGAVSTPQMVASGGSRQLGPALRSLIDSGTLSARESLVTVDPEEHPHRSPAVELGPEGPMGRLIYSNLEGRIGLRLLETRGFDSGGVHLGYGADPDR
jgi:hypothetical protein